VVALFGRSGCGKTTTINIISGLLAADEAHVELDGRVLADTAAGISVPPEERRIGYVFQDGRLFPHLSVLRNLRYGLKRARAPRQTIGFDHIVQLLGLEHLLQRQPYQLSGGERQRVCLGRALLSQPGMLLLDEPLAALDAARREEVLPYLERLRDNLSIPMVYVSHQFDEVLQLATHVVLMDAGRVVAQGSLREVSLLPQLRAIVGPDSVGAVVDGVVTTVDQSCGMAELRVGSGSLNVSVSPVSVGDHVRVQLLARDIILGTEEPRGLSVRNQLRGAIASVVDDEEDARLVTVDVGGVNVLSRVTRGAVEALGLKSGMSVWVLVKAVSTRGHAFRMAPRQI
jgi:molybdate transport system ATP-binding protein